MAMDPRGGTDSGDPAAAIGLGIRLHARGDHDGAIAAFLEAANSGHPDHASEAALHLGALLHSRGDAQGAQAMYQQAVSAGHSDHTLRAAVQLGIVLGEQELLAEAQSAFELAVSSGHHDHAPKAARHLGELLERNGDAKGAQRGYQCAADSGHPYEAPPAAVRLGDLHRRAGDLEAAQQAYQRAIDTGHPEHGPAAAAKLGELLQARGQPGGAVNQPEDSDDAAQSRQCGGAVGPLLPILQPLDFAESYAMTASDGGRLHNPAARPLLLAGRHVGYVSFGRDWRPSIQELGEWSIYTIGGFDDAAGMALGEAEALANLGLVGLEWKAHEGELHPDEPFDLLLCTRHHCASAAVLDPTFLTQAQGILGCPRLLVAIPEGPGMLAARADLKPKQVEALAAAVGDLHASADHPLTPLLFYATDGVVDGIHAGSDPGDGSAAALIALAERRLEAMDGRGAERAYRQVMDSGDPQHAPEAARRLGDLLADLADDEGARQAYQRAIDFGPSDAGQLAAYSLGVHLHQRGDIEGARRNWSLVADPQCPMYAMAAFNLGAVLAGLGDVEAAAKSLRRAAESDDPEVAERATEVLHRFEEDMGLAQEVTRDPAGDGPILPVLQPLDWADTFGVLELEADRLLTAMSRPLVLADRHVGYIAFGRMTPTIIHMESPEPPQAGASISAEYEAAAVMNLPSLGLEWERSELGFNDDDGFGVLVCSGHPLAAAAVLDPSFLARAQLILGCGRLVVALPTQDLLLVGSAELPAAQLALFAEAADAFHVSNRRRVTPLTFYATDGVVDGVYAELGSSRAS